ncbi:hypothetical protein L0F63_006343 [Massospora cicadina]|nr:hypothetical protein L0F63_006343 [Massospora cicadina]
MMDTPETKPDLSSEFEDEEILQLKKALLVDNDNDTETYEQPAGLLPNPGVDPLALLQSLAPQVPHLPIPHFSPFNFNTGLMPSTLAYPDYSDLGSSGIAKFSHPGLHDQSSAVNANSMAVNYDFGPLSSGRSPFQPTQLGHKGLRPEAMGYLSGGLGNEPTQKGLLRPAAEQGDVNTAPEGNGIGEGNDFLLQLSASSPTHADEGAQPNSITFLGREFRVGEFVVLKTKPPGEGVSAKPEGSIEAWHYPWNALRPTQPAEPRRAPKLSPRELVRLANKSRCCLLNFIGRCHVLPESLFTRGRPRGSQPHEPIYMVRYRYIEKRRCVFKIKSRLGMSYDLDIVPFDAAPVAPQTLVPPPVESKAPAPIAHSGDIPPPEASVSTSSPLKKACVPKIKTRDAGYIASIKESFPCDEANNLMWFDAPPIHRPAKALKVGLSLDFLVHLAKKRASQEVAPKFSHSVDE